MRITRRLVGAALSLALLAVAQPSAAAGEKITTVISTTGFVYMPLFVAEASGYFEKEGIQSEVVVTGGEAKSLAAVLSNSAQIFLGTPASSLRTRANGTDMTTIGAITTQYGSNIVVSRAWAAKHGITPQSTPAQRLAALKGATLGVTAIGSGTDMLVRYLAKQASLNPSRDLTVTGVGSGDAALAALSQDRIQGFSLASPAGEFAVKQQNAVMLFNLAAGDVPSLDGFLYIAINARASWLDENAAVATRYLKVIQRALDAIHDPKTTDAARDVVWKKYYPKVEKALFDEMWATSRKMYPETVAASEAMVRRTFEFSNEFEPTPIPPAALKGAWRGDLATGATGR